MIFLTRPHPDVITSALFFRKKGYAIWIEPLITIQSLKLPLDYEDPPQAIIVTSGNAINAIGGSFFIETLLPVPVYAVGTHTAKRARKIGFSNVHAADGTVGELIKLVKEECRPEQGEILYLSSTITAYDIPALLKAEQFTTTRIEVYDVLAREEFSAQTIKLIKARKITAVLFYSPRTAKIFKELLEKAHCSQYVDTMRAYTLNARGAESLVGLPFKEILTAEHPTSESLLELVVEYEQN